MEGLAQLGINIPMLLAQIVNATVLFALLYFVAWKRLMKIVDKRTQKIKEGVELTEHIDEMLAQADEEKARRIEAATKEEQGVIEQARQNVEQIEKEAQEQGFEKGRQEAAELIAEARTQIKHDWHEALDKQGRAIADLTVSATEKVIGKTLGRAERKRIVEEVLKNEIARLKKEPYYSIKK